MNNLAKIRGKHGLTQTELAHKLGMTKGGISFLEVNKLSVKSAEKIATVLNENVFSILGTDSFRIMPKTEEDKEALIEIIKGM